MPPFSWRSLEAPGAQQDRQGPTRQHDTVHTNLLQTHPVPGTVTSSSPPDFTPTRGVQLFELPFLSQVRMKCLPHSEMPGRTSQTRRRAPTPTFRARRCPEWAQRKQSGARRGLRLRR